MTIGSSLMASQYTNSNVQAQSGASGYASQGGGVDFSSMAQQFMSTMDTNKSGSVDKAEFSQAAQALAQNANNSSSSNVNAAFAKIDTNGDGQISSDEMMAALKQASTQTQGKHHHGHHHHSSDASASTATSQSTQTDSSTQASTMSDVQKSLFNKIMATYGNSALSLSTGTSATTVA
ncbi:EF-hand domain-containing protein [Sulfuricurvum sp.]|uniref:EF-hand domain-containing protein n=1 Tax=Sulfuricurvum sp. TaxID=2025608 RepID=UPI00356B4EFF